MYSEMIGQRTTETIANFKQFFRYTLIPLIPIFIAYDFQKYPLHFSRGVICRYGKKSATDGVRLFFKAELPNLEF